MKTIDQQLEILNKYCADSKKSVKKVEIEDNTVYMYDMCMSHGDNYNSYFTVDLLEQHDLIN